MIAFVANVLVANAKTVAAVITGSASMVAEAAHSWADADNEIFLLIGVLLRGVAIVLIDRNRRYLVGANLASDARNRVGRALLAQPDVERVTYLHLEYVGPDRLFLVDHAFEVLVPGLDTRPRFARALLDHQE